MPMDRDSLVAVLERRFDHYSARSVLGEVLSRLGIEGRAAYAAADLARIADELAQPQRRAETVVEELRRLAAEARRAEAPPVPTPPAPVPVPIAAKTDDKPAAKTPAKADPPAIEVVLGSAQETDCPAGASVRLVSDRPATVRWGVRGWKSPPAELRPAGTSKTDSESVETVLVPHAGPHPFALVIGPLTASVAELNFVARFDDRSWTKDAKVRVVAR